MKLLLGILIGIVISVPATTMAVSRIHDKTFSTDGFKPSLIGRYDDPNFKVKCWFTQDNSYSSSVSCLPWDQVKER